MSVTTNPNMSEPAHGEAPPHPCHACGDLVSQSFFELSSVPVHCNVLWPTAEAAATAPRGRLRLGLCRGCGLVFNMTFDPRLVTYDGVYENSLHYSPRFQQYAETLARGLSDRYALRDELVVEVGCGKGDFLTLLCETSGARGLGIDASYDPSIADAPREGVAFVSQPFESLSAEITPALIVCRHVVEHLEDPRTFVAEFAATVRRSPGCHVFLEVPNVLFTLRELGIWDLIYEHCSYFSAPAISRLCETAGLDAERVYSAYGDQFLCAEASLGLARSKTAFGAELRELSELSDRFAAEYNRRVSHWRDRLELLRAEGRKVVVWGAGSKGVTFVNTVPGGETVSCLVDLNPRKHHRYVPGTAQQVVAPEALTEVLPDVVVVMNPLYQEEILKSTSQLGLNCDVEVA